MAAVQLTVSAFDAMMKEIYPSWRVENLAVRKRPLLQWLPKREEFYGDTLVVPVLHEDPQSAGLASLSNAITYAETSKQTKFVLTARQKSYGVVQVEAEAIMAASKDVGAFIRAKSTQINGMLRQMGKIMHLNLYRDGNGYLGVISAIGNGSGTNDLLTLTNPSDVYNFGVGQSLVIDDASAGSSLHTTDGSVTAVVKVERVDHANAQIEVDANTDWSGGGGATTAVTDFLFPVSNPSSVITGLAGWLPLSAPSSTAFFGVDRTTNIAALSGHRVDNTGRSILTNAEELAMLIGEFGGEPDALFCNPRTGLQLAEEVGAKVERTDGGAARVGFSGFTLVNFVTGPVQVIFDIGCPPDRAYMLQKDTWTVAHLGGLPHIVRDDGRDSLRSYDGTYDGIEVRCRSFAELYCRAPGYNGVMSVATA
jgi:hypothetical protein